MLPMLEYQKMILNKVSFDKRLFKKELLKSFKWLEPEEIKNLQDWVQDKHNNEHSDIIEEVFCCIAA